MRSGKILKRLFNFFVGFSVVLLSSTAFANSGITYQGRILKPDGTPLAGANVQFKMQIRTPDSSNCLMYEEVQSLDMRNANGTFAVTINDGTGTRTDLTGLNLDRIFSNAQGVANLFSFNPATCTVGSTYAPNPGDGRAFVVYFKDETMAAFEPMPVQKINFVPFAFESKQIAGFTPASLVRVAESDGTLDSVSPLSNANYTALLALINGTSNQYTKQSASAGSVVSATSGNVATPAAGSVWLDTAAGNLKFYDGTTVKTVGTSGGSVTSVATGTGLTGGPITSSGTISLATLGAGGTGYKVTYDTYGRVTGAVALVEADIPTLTTAGHVSGSAITSGTIGGTTAINTSGTITSSSLSSTAVATQSVQIFETTNSFKVTIQAPASLSANYALTLPTTAGGVNQVLTTNGSGVLSWTTPAGTGISALTGDVSASGSGSVAATVNSVGTSTAANIHSAELLANAATNLNTVSTIVKRDGSGNFAASAITSTSNVLKDSGANTVTLSAPTTVTTSYVLKLPAAVASVAGQYLSSDTSGNLSWTTLPSSMAPSGAASGDLSGTYPGPTVATVGTSTAANIHSAELAANGAVSANTASKIVLRDASGNFASNVATLNGLALNNAGSVLNIVNPVGGAWNMTLPATAGTSGQVMQTNGSGLMSWSTLPTALPPNGSAGGDLSGTYPNPTVATVGTSTAANIHSAELAANGAVSTNTASKIVLRDASGNFASNVITGNGFTLNNAGSLLNIVSPIGGAWTMTLPATAGTSGQVMQTNGSGVMTWVTPLTSSTGFINGGNSFGANASIGTNDVFRLDIKTNNAVAMTVDTTGKVGIGTTSPATMLQVNGTIMLGDGGETCGASYAGAIRYNTGNVQFCNGTAWGALGSGGSGITALTGDVTASGTGSVAATVAQVGGSTAANVHAAELLANAATNVNTVSTIVKRDASGNFAAAGITHTSSIFKDSGSNTVTVSAPTTVTTSYAMKWPAAIAGTAGQVLSSDTSGNLSWYTLPAALPPNGAAGGDLSGSYPNPTVAKVGTSTAANVHSAELAANGATAVNTASKIIARDASGNFASNVATVNGLSLNNAGSVLNVTNPVGGAWNLVLPATAGSNGQVLKTDGAGNTSWGPSSTAPLYAISNQSSNFTVGSSTNYTYYLVTGITSASLPSAVTVGAGFVVGIKRVGTGNVNIIPAGTEKIDGSNTTYSLGTNYAHVTLISDGSNWNIVDGGATTTSSGCTPGSQSYAAGSTYTLTVTAAQVTAGCVFSVSVKGAGGGSAQAGSGAAGGGVSFTYTPASAGSFSIKVGSKGDKGGYYGGTGAGGFAGGGKGGSAYYGGGGGGGASSVVYAGTLLAVAGGGGGGSGTYNSSSGSGGAGGSGGAAGANAPGGAYAGLGASAGTAGAGGATGVAGGAGGATGSNGTAGVSNTSSGGTGDTTYSIGGGGGGGYYSTNTGGGGGGGYAGGGGGSTDSGSNGGGGGGGSGYINSGGVTSFSSISGAAADADGSVVINWN